jgi:hypothetical protein
LLIFVDEAQIMAAEKPDVEKAMAAKPKPDSRIIVTEMTTGEKVFHYAYDSCDEDPHFMEFRFLQWLNIVELQNDLATREAAFRNKKSIATVETKDSGTEKRGPSTEKTDSGAKMKELRTKLHEYGTAPRMCHIHSPELIGSMLVTAIQDYEYTQKMGNCSKRDEERIRNELTIAFKDIASLPHEPYKTSYRLIKDAELDGLDIVHDALRICLPRYWSYSEEEKRRRVYDYYIEKKSPSGISGFVDRAALFLIGIFSGASLIGPMIIMSLDKSLNKSLITTSVAVTLFAAFISLVIKAKKTDIISATAAYAAVLVVFVGVSGP